MTRTYKEAGVDIDAGNEFVGKITRFAKGTYRPEVISGIGGFGALFALNPSRYKEPILISSTDGVGTKLLIAQELKKFDTIGQDLVAMCVNDVCCSGAEPLFFLDYFATGKLKPNEHAAIIEGIAGACKEVGCALIGGETAEMPDLYHGDDFDLAGFAVGVVERGEIVDGSGIAIGDTIIGISSSGLHSNGYSLVRAILKEKRLKLNHPIGSETKTLGEILLTPTKLYPRLLTALRRDFKIKGIAHITGGGLPGNVPRVLPASCQARISLSSWERPFIFKYLQETAKIDEDEMLKVFNCGIGLVMVVDSEVTLEIIERIRSHKEEAWIVGEIVKRPQNGPDIEFV